MAHWMTTWAQAHADMSMLCKNNKDYTARLTVFSEFPGDKLRIRVSNQEGKATVALAGASVQIEEQAPVGLCFDGKETLCLQPGEVVYSDPLALTVRAGAAVTVSLAFTGAACSGNNLPEYTRLSKKGNYTQCAQMPQAKTSLMAKINGLDPVMPVLSAIEVYSEAQKDVLVCFGDSITQMSRWTKPLADQLRYTDKNMVVINKGIAGNQLLSDPTIPMMSMYGTAAVKRFQEDVLSVNGASAVLFALGVNDLNMVKDEKSLEGMAGKIVDTLEQLAAQARDAGMKVYAATVTPCGGCKGYRAFTNPVREKINRILLSSAAFDGTVDFDAIVRDPADPSVMQEMCDSGDHLHPGVIGGKKMAEEVYQMLTGKTEK